MGKVCKPKNILTIFVFLLIIMSGVRSQAEGTIHKWELFKTQPEFDLYAAGREADKISFAQDDYYKMINIVPAESNTANKKMDSSWDLLKFHNVSVSFSHLVIQQLQIDAAKTTGEEIDKSNTIKSLPTMFLTSSYKDAFGSIGKVFEPQLNLRIEF